MNGSGEMEGSTWLAQSVEQMTLDLGVVSSSPTLGIEITLKNREANGTEELLLKSYLILDHLNSNSHMYLLSTVPGTSIALEKCISLTSPRALNVTSRQAAWKVEKQEWFKLFFPAHPETSFLPPFQVAANILCLVSIHCKDFACTSVKIAYSVLFCCCCKHLILLSAD